jgi:uncharacterized protein (DUF1697 family)
VLCVAFLRNLNQGQRGQLATADLLSAFSDAGAAEASTFQSNGTVVFSSEDADAVGRRVRESLASQGLFDDLLVVRPIILVEDIVGEFAELHDAHRCELTLFADDRFLDDDAALTAAATRRRCTVVARGPGWAVVRNERDRQTNGTPTIEAVLGERATSRGLPTLLRLVDRFSR